MLMKRHAMTTEERAQLHRKFDAEIANLIVETAKLNAETAKLTTENRWYLLVIGSGATLAIVAVVNIFMR